MKKFTSYVVTLVVLVSAAIGFSACDGNDGPSATEKQMKLLVGTWNMTSVTVDGVDRTSLFDGFTLTFTDVPPMFTPANGGKVWTNSQPFYFVNGTTTEFSGPNSQLVTITTLTENALVLQMDWNETTLNTGRTKSIAGTHVFVFNK